MLIFIARRCNELAELIYIPLQWKNTVIASETG